MFRVTIERLSDGDGGSVWSASATGCMAQHDLFAGRNEDVALAATIRDALRMVSCHLWNVHMVLASIVNDLSEDSGAQVIEWMRAEFGVVSEGAYEVVETCRKRWEEMKKKREATA